MRRLLTGLATVTIAAAVSSLLATAAYAAPQASKPAIAAGSSTEVVNANSGLCLEVYHSQTTNYANVDQYACNGSLTQQWNVVAEFNNYVEIVNANSGKCLEVYHSETTDYANVDQYTCNDTLTQEWYG